MKLKKLQGLAKKELSVIPYLNKDREDPYYSNSLIQNRADELSSYLKSVGDDIDVAKLFSLVRAVHDSVFYRADRTGREIRIYPSTFFYSCKRRLYYEHTGIEPSNPDNYYISPNLRRVFDIGHFMHSYLQTDLHTSNILVTAEERIFDESLNLSGRIDGVIKIDNETLILEIKTIDGFAFNSLTRPYDTHISQVQIYMGYKKLDKAILVYVNKSTGELKEFIIEFSRIEYNALIDEIKSFSEDVKNLNPPMRICSSTKSQTAKSCIYCNHCFNII